MSPIQHNPGPVSPGAVVLDSERAPAPSHPLNRQTSADFLRAIRAAERIAEPLREVLIQHAVAKVAQRAGMAGEEELQAIRAGEGVFGASERGKIALSQLTGHYARLLALEEGRAQGRISDAEFGEQANRISVDQTRLLGVLSGVMGGDRAPTVPTQSPVAVHGAIESGIRATANEYFGRPYRWGGISRGGIDCSGLVERFAENMLRAAGIEETFHNITTGVLKSASEGVRSSSDPRVASDLRSLGEYFDFHRLREVGVGGVVPGDIIFWRSGGKGHTGVVIGPGTYSYRDGRGNPQSITVREISVLHASSSRGRVVVDPVRSFVGGKGSQAQVVRVKPELAAGLDLQEVSAKAFEGVDLDLPADGA